VRVGALRRGSSWFPRADIGLAPSFEILEDVAAPRRGILRARQTFAGSRAAATVATSVATAAKGLAMGSWADMVPFLCVFLSHKMFLMSWFHQ
jgi:uncharacterized protein (DUF2062 family)